MRVEDTTTSAGDAMRVKFFAQEMSAKFRPMRGQCYVEVFREKSSTVIALMGDPLDDRYYCGRVLALGEPARLTDDPRSPELSWDVSVGDRVLFEPQVAMDRMRTFRMEGVRGDVMVVAQIEVMAVDGG